MSPEGATESPIFLCLSPLPGLAAIVRISFQGLAPLANNCRRSAAAMRSTRGCKLRFVSPKGCQRLAQGCCAASYPGARCRVDTSTLKGLRRAAHLRNPVGVLEPLGLRSPGWPLRATLGCALQALRATDFQPPGHSPYRTFATLPKAECPPFSCRGVASCDQRNAHCPDACSSTARGRSLARRFQGISAAPGMARGKSPCCRGP